MQLALECPTPLMESLLPLTDFYFALTHLVLKDAKYCDYYTVHKDKKLILDNSTNELGEPCTVDDILRAADLIKPDVIVPPDYLGDMERTFEDVMLFSRMGVKNILPVVQGSTIKECYKCADKYLSQGFEQCAVPYDPACSKGDSISKMTVNRQRLVVGLVAHFKWIHLLGMTTLEEFRFYRRLKERCKMSVDTGSPVMHGLMGVKFGRDPLYDKSKPTLDMMKPSGELSLVYHNIAVLRRECNDI